MLYPADMVKGSLRCIAPLLMAAVLPLAARADPAGEAKQIADVLAPVGSFQVKSADGREYLLGLTDAQGQDAGLLVLRMGTPDRVTRFHSRRFSMEIWNISPDMKVVDQLVRAARAVAVWDGGPQVDQPINTGSEPMEEMTWVAIVAVVLAMIMGIIRRGRISFDFREPHVRQVLAQGSIYVYWALYWPGVIAHVPAMGVQLILAYAADAFFCLWRFKSWRFGLGVIPVVFSINLFEWFDWHAAFVGIVVAFAAKVWLHRGGRHIFNPSVIGLTIVGVISIFAPDFVHFASAFHTLNLPPNMAEFTLLAALIPQTRYRILPISFGAMLALWSTGNPALVRPAIILGFTLLASDPATTPGGDVGKVLFGAVVGFGLPLFSILMRHLGQPDDFAKVMAVAVGNLVAPELDWLSTRAVGLVTRGWQAFLATGGRLTALAARLTARPIHNMVFVVAWLVLCGGLLVGEKARDFEPSLHWNWGTPLVVHDAEDVPRCENNPAFCQPFSFTQELALWMKGPARHDAGVGGAQASR